MSANELQAAFLQALTTEKTRRLTENKLAYYKAYPKQLEFHAAGATHRERLLMAGNHISRWFRGRDPRHWSLSRLVERQTLRQASPASRWQRPDGRHPLCTHDVALCPHGKRAAQLSPRDRISINGAFLMSKPFETVFVTMRPPR